jgi:hypothetical protein
MRRGGARLEAFKFAMYLFGARCEDRHTRMPTPPCCARAVQCRLQALWPSRTPSSCTGSYAGYETRAAAFALTAGLQTGFVRYPPEAEKPPVGDEMLKYTQKRQR